MMRVDAEAYTDLFVFPAGSLGLASHAEESAS